MTDLLDSQGRPAIANDEPELLKLWEEGFGFPIPVMDGEKLKMMALVPNQGHVPMLPEGAPVWEHDPLVALVVYETHKGFEEVKTEIKDAKGAASAEIDDRERELLSRIEKLEADRANDAHELQRLRERIEGMVK